MSKVRETTAGQDRPPQTLRECVEEMAVQMVLGNLDRAERMAGLNNICAAAQAAGRVEVALTATDALDVLSKTADAVAFDGHLSTAIG